MEKWGWNGSDTSWDTWIIVNADLDNTGCVKVFAAYSQFTVTLQYCTSEKEWVQIKEMLGIDDETTNSDIDFSSPLTTFGKNANDVIDKTVRGYESLKEIVKNFQHNPVGTILSLVIDLIRALGDGIQWLANLIQSPVKHFFVEYSRDTLETEGEKGDLNQYTRVSYYKKGDAKDWQKVIDIEKTDDQDNRFDEDTKIPVMIGDIYNVAVGHIDVFDINFLKVSKANKKNTAWMVLRNFVANLIHISFYIACATLLVNLILGGITIVKSSFDNPEQQAEAKRRIDSLGTSVATLIGTVVIMALSIYGSNQIFSGLDNTKNVELPIRVNVEGAGYSFSTTAAGYFKYMSHFNDVDEWIEKGFYTLGYIVLALLNLLMIVVMLLRMLALWILAIAGPLIAVLSVWNLDSKNLFRTWVKLYVGLSMIPVAISIIYLLLLDIAI